MTLAFGGGAGVLTIPGVGGDGQTPPGIVVAGAVTAGDAHAAVIPTFHQFYGELRIDSSPANNPDNAQLFYIFDNQPLSADSGNPLAQLVRVGSLNGHQYTAPVLWITDGSGSTASLQEWWGQSAMVAQLGHAGGLGLFGHPAPTAPSTLPQATITAISDANAKAAVQAIADCLAAIGVLTLT